MLVKEATEVKPKWEVASVHFKSRSIIINEPLYVYAAIYSIILQGSFEAISKYMIKSWLLIFSEIVMWHSQVNLYYVSKVMGVSTRVHMLNISYSISHNM